MFENVFNCGAGKFVSAEEWIHPKRIINSYEIILVTKGVVYINENGVSYTLKKDEVLVLEPNVPHGGFKSGNDIEFFWLHFNGLSELSTSMKYKKLENTYAVSLYFRQILSGRVSGMLRESTDSLTRLILAEIFTNGKSPITNPVAEKAAAYIAANNHTCLTENKVAQSLGYNADYLNRMFKKSFSKTVKQYIVEKRLEYIKSIMLCEDLTLAEISDKAGFSEYKYFLKFFKYHEGITPTRFCAQYAKTYINSR